MDMVNLLHYWVPNTILISRKRQNFKNLKFSFHQVKCRFMVFVFLKHSQSTVMSFHLIYHSPSETIKITVLWDVTPCSYGYQYFTGICYLHLQGRQQFLSKCWYLSTKLERWQSQYSPLCQPQVSE
jgi:hypothetical protein